MKRYFGMRIGKHLCAVWVLGEGNTGFLSPRLSLRMFSATGFGWGDDGPPAQQAQLALALLCDAIEDDEIALTLYAQCQGELLLKLPAEGWMLTQDDILRWAVVTLARRLSPRGTNGAQEGPHDQ
jgi:hypothetical protein